jgi:hypothetical protein
MKGDDPVLRRKVLADLVASRSRGGMRSIPRSGSSGQGNKKARSISDVAQVKR